MRPARPVRWALLTALVSGALAVPALPATAAPVAEPTASVGVVVGEGSASAVRDQFVVSWREPAAGRAAARRIGARPLTTTPDGMVADLTTAAARHLAADPAVAAVEQDQWVRLSGVQRTSTWGLDRVDQRRLPLSRSYQYARPSATVTAYVLDTGVRISHHEFAGRARYGWDTVDDDSSAGDCEGHGTHVAGIIGGATSGVAKYVKVVSVRVLNCKGWGTYSQISAGIDWVREHAVKPAVLNLSLGGPPSNIFDTSVKRAIEDGITVVAAAGNEHRNACGKSPARVPAVITVAATDDQDYRPPFSNFGRCVDLFAPGVNIRSASRRGNSAFAYLSGTSMAAPYVAGAAAVLLGAHPRWSPARVAQALVAMSTRGAVKRPGTATRNRLLYLP